MATTTVAQQLAKSANRKERYSAQDTINAGLEEYREELDNPGDGLESLSEKLDEAQKTRFNRQLVLRGIYPTTMEEMSTRDEHTAMVGQLDELTFEEREIAQSTYHRLFMHELWHEDMQSLYPNMATSGDETLVA